MRDHVAAASIDGVPALVNGDDINSGIYHEIGGNTPAYSVGLGNTRYKPKDNPIRLTGCTLLAVMSQKAMWIGHFWESLLLPLQSLGPLPCSLMLPLCSLTLPLLLCCHHMLQGTETRRNNTSALPRGIDVMHIISFLQMEYLDLIEFLFFAPLESIL